MLVKLCKNFLRLLVIYLSGQIQETLPERMVIPAIARTLIIGKITARIKGVFKVVGPSGEEVSGKTKETISGDLHDRGEGRGRSSNFFSSSDPKIVLIHHLFLNRKRKSFFF
jgi:hypothetical protein